MFKLKETSWLEGFSETQQDIMEDAFLLEALAWYAVNNGSLMRGERGEYFPLVFKRLCDYLSQHALELHHLRERMGGQP